MTDKQNAGSFRLEEYKYLSNAILFYRGLEFRTIVSAFILNGGILGLSGRISVFTKELFFSILSASILLSFFLMALLITHNIRIIRIGTYIRDELALDVRAFCNDDNLILWQSRKGISMNSNKGSLVSFLRWISVSNVFYCLAIWFPSTGYFLWLAMDFNSLMEAERTTMLVSMIWFDAILVSINTILLIGTFMGSLEHEKPESPKSKLID